MAPVRTVVQLVVLDDTGDSAYRMRWPARSLARLDPALRVLNVDARSPHRHAAAAAADLLVLYQSGDRSLLPVLAARRGRGLPTLVEYNDNFYAPPAASPVRKAWSSPLVWQTYEEFLRAADGVLVTGPGLRALFSGVTSSPVFELPNHLPEPPPPFSWRWRKPPLPVGWAGSVGHASDLLTAAPLLRRLAAARPGLEVHVMGNEGFPSVLGVPPENLRFTPWGSTDAYYRFLRGIAIGLVPLVDTPYNRCRSDVKAVEIAAAGAAPVLPDLPPYDEFAAATGLPRYRTPAGRDELTERFVADPKAAAEAARAAHSYVARERVQDGRPERLRLYRDYLDRAAGPAPAERGGWKEGPGYHEYGADSPAPLDAPRPTVSSSGPSGGPPGPDARLAALEAAAPSAAPDRLLAEALRATEVYPRDLRFLLLACGEGRVPAAWKELLDRLEGAAPAAREFYRRAACGRAARSGKLTAPPAEAERLAALYPEEMPLRLALGEWHAAAGDPTAAAPHLETVVRGARFCAENGTFASTIDLLPLVCLAEACRAEAAEQEAGGADLLSDDRSPV